MLSFTTQFGESTQTIEPSEICAYTLRRAISSPRMMNVVAVDKEGELLFVLESDMEFDDAAELVEKKNKALSCSDINFYN